LKKFLTLTAILESLTGIALIAIPNSIVLFLFGKPTDGYGGMITAMLAGAAVFSLAVVCWLLRESTNPQKLVKGMLFYNCIITAIALYGVFCNNITGPGLWLIVIVHVGLSFWGAVTLLLKKNI
jgi:predicted membrane-bound spermidine synthase